MRPGLNRWAAGGEFPVRGALRARAPSGEETLSPVKRILPAGTWHADLVPAPLVAAGVVPPPAARRRRQHGLLAWAADPGSSGTRRGLQVALGVAWLLDAALQYQPYMFGRGFITQVLAPATAGNPALIARPAMAAGWLIGHDVAFWNALFATTQLAIAAGLLWRRTARAALAATIAWSLAVWWLGEGLGGLLTGTATPLTGAPGAAVLYALLAVLAWPPRPGRQGGNSVADGSPLRRGGARLAWLTLWVSMAYLVLQPSGRSPRALHDLLSGLAGTTPGWIASADRGAAAAAGSHGTIASAVIAAIFVLIGAGVLGRATTRPALVAAVIAALAIWSAGENFGAIFTGQGTDPNTGPLLILLAAAFWPGAGTRPGPAPGQRATAYPARVPTPGREPELAPRRTPSVTSDEEAPMVIPAGRQYPDTGQGAPW